MGPRGEKARTLAKKGSRVNKEGGKKEMGTWIKIAAFSVTKGAEK